MEEWGYTMKHVKPPRMNRTFVIYFLSYMLVFTVLFLGFIYILKNNILGRSFVQARQQAQEQLSFFNDQLDAEFERLIAVDNSIKSNISLIKARYDSSPLGKAEITDELKKYVSSTQLISSIVYLQEDNSCLAYTRDYVTYSDGVFQIQQNYKDAYPLCFRPNPDFYGAASGQCLFLSSGATNRLIYFPPQNESMNYTYFYILDTGYICQQIQSQISSIVPAIALIDSDRQIVASQRPELLQSHLPSLPPEKGLYTLDQSNSLLVLSSIYTDLTIVSLISNDYLNNYINSSFSGAYLTLLILAAVDVLLIWLAMHFTYSPLYKLVHRTLPTLDTKQSQLTQLDQFLTDISQKNQLQEAKLSHYQHLTQKALLDSCLHLELSDSSALQQNLDLLFEQTLDKDIFIVRLKALSQPPQIQEIQDIFQKSLTPKSFCAVVEQKDDTAVLLISYTGTEPNKNATIAELLNTICEERGCLAAVSVGSSSPLDIPFLYESTLRASALWPQVPVVNCKDYPDSSTSLSYPHGQLSRLSDCLRENDFPGARMAAKELFAIAGDAMLLETELPNFFVHSILVDMVTILTSHMHQINIRFDRYNDLYYDILQCCRTFSYQEKIDEITGNILRLIDICETEIESKIINPVQIRQIIESSFHQPSFSIQSLADSFQTSIAYMSYLVKKELHQNFSEYLWSLRESKARELLRDTDMSIDDISLAVGYFNASSFRRKFKQKTGLTPSQYRQENQK